MQRFNLFIRLLDFLFPPSDDARSVRTLTNGDIAYLFHEERSGDILSLSYFSNPKIRALIHEAKFHNNTRAQTLLGHLFSMHMEYRLPQYDTIIPIPLSPQRERSRGYNQVYEVLARAPHKEPLPVVQNALSRTRNTRPQTDLPKHERHTNLKHAFAVSLPQYIYKKRVLIVDDVATTGATLRAARDAVLFHEPASLTLLALAH